MNAFVKFNKGLLGMPLPWQVWVMLLTALNAVVPFFYLDRPEARVILAVMVLNAALMVAITGLAGFTRILGLGHFLWFGLLYYLWTQLGAIPAGDFYGGWIRAVMVVNAISLAIDVVDVARYLGGDRAETVPGLSEGGTRLPRA
ncbi:MAG: hypothetical protein V3U03_15245 [Myxococcota bacterium]